LPHIFNNDSRLQATGIVIAVYYTHLNLMLILHLEFCKVAGDFCVTVVTEACT
jgi:hypothetical protein